MTPKWVTDLVDRAYAEHQLGGRMKPRVNWRRGSSIYSSGHCYYDHIAVTGGADRRDARLVLLHELGHWRAGSGHHHDDYFWRCFFDLVKWDGRLTWKYVLEREGPYRAQAIKTAKAMGIRGAGTAAKAARAERRIRNARPPRGYCPVPAGQCTFNRKPVHTHYLNMHLFMGGIEYVVTEKTRPPWQKEAA